MKTESEKVMISSSMGLVPKSGLSKTGSQTDPNSGDFNGGLLDD